MILNKTLLITSLLLSLTQPVWALRSDRDKTINIKADNVVIDEKKAISHYRGNVSLKQGTLIITADEVIVHLIKGRLDRIVIHGKPARFEQQPENKQEIVKSIANHMEYFSTKEHLVLTENAEIIQGGNRFQGDHIEYDTYNSIVKASKDSNSTSRVHAVIEPAKEDDKPPKQDSTTKP